MKRYFDTNILLILLTLIVLFASCNKSDSDANLPIVTLTEVGHNNSKCAHPGHDMHLEADIIAEAGISRIKVELRQEDGIDFQIKLLFTDGKYIGVRNTEFHEHIDIPADAPLGNYSLHFTVTDNNGLQTKVECGIEVTEYDDNEEKN